MNNKIYKYSEYLKENMLEVPENYVENALRKLKSRLEKMFSNDSVEGGEVKKYGEVSDKNKREKGEMSFKDLGLELQSLEVSKYSKIYDNVKDYNKYVHKCSLKKYITLCISLLIHNSIKSFDKEDKQNIYEEDGLSKILKNADINTYYPQLIMLLQINK